MTIEGKPIGDTRSSHFPRRPVSSYAAVFDFKSSRPWGIRAGEAIPARYGSLIEGSADDLETLGGCLCLQTSVFTKGVRHVELTDWDPIFDRMREVMDQEQLSRVGKPFIPYILSIQDGPYILLCIPVQRRTQRSWKERLPHRFADFFTSSWKK